MEQKKLHDLKVLAAQIRVETMKVIHSRGFGHVGGSMSIADTMAVLYGDVMKFDPKNPRWEDRDFFVLSKGHAGPALYATLGIMGYYPMEDAYTLNQPGTRFPSHPDRNATPGVDITVGSLGQGISQAVGVALGQKLQKKDSRVYTIVGDGESDEGQVWEAAEAAAHYKLDNITCYVDDNGLQLDGPTAKIMSHGKGLAAKFDAFGWNVIELEDGNDVEAIWEATQKALAYHDGPTAIVLHTIKGKGAFFAESVGAHSSQPPEEDWQKALAEVEAAYEAVKAE
ncbi:MAG: transketolase [Eubacterium sp.]|nr:transketolase [Eubacterium sp.]